MILFYVCNFISPFFAQLLFQTHWNLLVGEHLFHLVVQFGLQLLAQNSHHLLLQLFLDFLS